MQFNNLDSLFKYIEKKTNEVMDNEVSKTVKENMSEAINDSVYDVYSPNYYDRRKLHGGLSDTDNMTVEQKDGSITVRNDTPLDNGRIDYRLDDIIVNRGVLGYEEPRDFYQETAERLENNKEHIEAMKRGLEKRKIGVE